MATSTNATTPKARRAERCRALPPSTRQLSQGTDSATTALAQLHTDIRSRQLPGRQQPERERGGERSRDTKRCHRQVDWHRRFGGRADVLGRTLTIGNTPLTIVGVAPAGFVRESSGQQPDVWLPLRLQPRVLPGTDWIHDTPPEKVMWLHLFARLKPTISAAQVETRANTCFELA
jgi:hypothetical protein